MNNQNKPRKQEFLDNLGNGKSLAEIDREEEYNDQLIERRKLKEKNGKNKRKNRRSKER